MDLSRLVLQAIPQYAEWQRNSAGQLGFRVKHEVAAYRALMPRTTQTDPMKMKSNLRVNAFNYAFVYDKVASVFYNPLFTPECGARFVTKWHSKLRTREEHLRLGIVAMKTWRAKRKEAPTASRPRSRQKVAETPSSVQVPSERPNATPSSRRAPSEPALKRATVPLHDGGDAEELAWSLRCPEAHRAYVAEKKAEREKEVASLQSRITEYESATLTTPRAFVRYCRDSARLHKIQI